MGGSAEMLFRFLDEPLETRKGDFLAALQQLTLYAKIKDNRDSLDGRVYDNLNSILLKSQDELFDGDPVKWSIYSEAFRFLRNACVSSRKNQDSIRNRSRLVQFASEFLLMCSNPEKKVSEDESKLVSLRCCLQFTGNSMVSNPDNCDIILSNATEFIVPLMKFSDDKVVQYMAMNAHVILKLRPEWGSQIDTEVVGLVIDKIDNEFVLCCFEGLCCSRGFMERGYILSCTEKRVHFLKILISDTPFHKHLNTQSIQFFMEEFKVKADLILQSKIETVLVEIWVCWEIVSLLELLCLLSTLEDDIDPRNDEAGILKKDKSLLITTTYLLKYLHETGKLGTNEFSPIEKLEQLTAAGVEESVQSHPGYFFKAHLIRLIANLVHQSPANQDQMRELDAISVILDCCKIDARNPFITQWSVLALRNLCLRNLENQRFIGSLVEQGRVESSVLQECRLTVDEDSGKLIFQDAAAATPEDRLA